MSSIITPIPRPDLEKIVARIKATAGTSSHRYRQGFQEGQQWAREFV